MDSQWEFVLWLKELKQGFCDKWWGGRREGGLGRRKHGCNYGWFLLMYNRKPQNTVKQLSFNLNKDRKKRKKNDERKELPVKYQVTKTWSLT